MFAISRAKITPAVCLVAAIFCGCTTQESDLTWSRAALERNPQIEVLAADPKTNVLTIRVKATGIVRTVKPEELAAAPQDLMEPPLQTAKTQAEAPPPLPPSEPVRVSESPDANAPPVVPAPPAAPTPPQPDSTAYKIARENGEVRVSGPGVSIVSAPSTKNETVANGAPNDPVVCEGRRFMHLDGRNINVSGDAVIVRNGCELHITNSRIAALAGSGIVVENATVHIANSQIKGSEASIDAGAAAKLYIRGSIFTGVLKKSDTTQINDSGANEWR